MKTRIITKILLAVLYCSTLFIAATAQVTAGTEGDNPPQSASPFAPPPPPPGPVPPPAPPPAPPPYPHPPGPIHPPAPSDWPYYYGTPWPGYYSSAWPWIGTHRYYYEVEPVVVTQTYPEPVYVPLISTFTSNPSYIQPGESAVLSWSTSNASNVTISPSVGSVASSGAFTVQPAATTTYTLTATGSGGTVSASTTVTVAQIVTAYSTTTAVSTPATATSQSSNSSAGTPWLLYMLLIALLAVVAVVIVLIVKRKPAVERSATRAAFTAAPTAVSNETGSVTTPATSSPGARLVTGSGGQIELGSSPATLGRRDFQSIVNLDKADLISRQHLLLNFDSGHYYIEDRQSTNGTRLNGIAIKGTGRHMLNDGDTIELGNALTLTFKTSTR